jgi:hypothetical protein
LLAFKPGVLQLQQQGALAGIVHGDAAVGHQQEQDLQEVPAHRRKLLLEALQEPPAEAG